MVTDPDHILYHPTDMVEGTLISTKSMMIDIQTIDIEVVIGSIKINMITPDTMAICIADHKVIHLKCTIIDNIMVKKAITCHKISGRATKIETKEGLPKNNTTNMVGNKGQNRGYHYGNNCYQRNNSNQHRN